MRKSPCALGLCLVKVAVRCKASSDILEATMKTLCFLQMASCPVMEGSAAGRTQPWMDQ